MGYGVTVQEIVGVGGDGKPIVARREVDPNEVSRTWGIVRPSLAEGSPQTRIVFKSGRSILVLGAVAEINRLVGIET